MIILPAYYEGLGGPSDVVGSAVKPTPVPNTLYL